MRLIVRSKLMVIAAISMCTGSLIARAAGAQQTGEGFIKPLPTNSALWINSRPLSATALRGKVVIIDFWAFECINCLRALPYLKALEAKYRRQGLIVIGVHTPELEEERNADDVRDRVKGLGITFPVVLDNDSQIWNEYHNHYWPALYFIDAQGRIRHQHFGEGQYDVSENVVKQLLTEARLTALQVGPETTKPARGGP